MLTSKIFRKLYSTKYININVRKLSSNLSIDNDNFYIESDIKYNKEKKYFYETEKVYYIFDKNKKDNLYFLDSEPMERCDNCRGFGYKIDLKDLKYTVCNLCKGIGYF